MKNIKRTNRGRAARQLLCVLMCFLVLAGGAGSYGALKNTAGEQAIDRPVRLAAKAKSYTYAATIDLSKTLNVTGTGFTISPNNNSTNNNYQPGYILDPATYQLAVLTFNASANGKAYNLIQSGKPNNPSPKGPKYGTSTVNIIKIETGVSVTLVVSEIDIIGAINIEGTGKLNLILDGTNNIRHCIKVRPNSELLIDSLNGNDEGDKLVINQTTPTSPTPAYNTCIGGDLGASSGTVTIKGGTVDITTRNGSDCSAAGIGGGGATSGVNGGNGGNINITGGIVKIASRSTGACIGGGGGWSISSSNYTNAGNGGNINISGGTLELSNHGDGALEGSGAGGACIGAGGSGAAGTSGSGGNGGNINISGGTITVRQYTRASGIGSGLFGSVGYITIDGGVIDSEVIGSDNVFASGEGSAIGGSSGTTAQVSGSITINGGSVRAVSKHTGIGLVHAPATCLITITGGNVYAKGGSGPGIGYWTAADPTLDGITITGGTVVAESDTNTGIGNNMPEGYESYLPKLNLGANANVRAYSGGGIPAINTRDNSGVGYFVNASFDAALSSSAATALYAFVESTGEWVKTMSLPKGYRHFAYSSDLASSRTDNVYAGTASSITGTVVRKTDNKLQIYSVKTRAGYNSHNNTANNMALPVKFLSGTYCTVTEKYVDKDGDPIPGMADTLKPLASGGTYSRTVPAIEGYKTKGYKWQTAPNGSGSDIMPGNPSATVNGNVDIYFVYSREYAVTEKYVDTSGVKIAEDTSTDVPAKTPAYTKAIPQISGYKAVGYHIGNSFTGAYTGGKAITNYQLTGDTTIYFVYQKLTTLTVSKTVTGAYGNRRQSFDFEVYFEESGGTPLTSAAALTFTKGGNGEAPETGVLDIDDEGLATFSLRHGENIIISGVAADDLFRVVEAAGGSDYETSFVDSTLGPGDGNDTGPQMRPMSVNRVISFTNEKRGIPETAIDPGEKGVMTGLIILILLMAGLAFPIVWMVTRRCKYGRDRD